MSSGAGRRLETSAAGRHGRRPAERLSAATWRLAVAASLAFYLDAATVITVAIALPLWRDHYRLDAWQVGLLSSGLAFGIAIGAVVGGRLGDRFGRGVVFTVDLMVFAAATIMIAFAPDAWTLLAGVVVVGLAAGADMPTALTVLSDAAPVGTHGRLVGLTQVSWIAAILITYALGFATSGLGFLGAQLLSLHLVVVALLTVLLRLTLAGPTRPVTRQPAAPPPRLRAAGALPALLATGGFLLLWNVASSTLGSYGTYVLVTVTGLTQTQATGLVLVGFPPALLMSVIFTRLADSPWRDRLFVVAMLLQIAAYTAGAATGGVVAGGMLVLVVLYSLSNVFAGEAIYKVWSQLLLPPAVRATAVGLSYGVARGVAAAFLLLVPLALESHAGELLWLLAGCVTASGLIGLVIINHRAWRPLLHPQRRTFTDTLSE